MNEIQELPEEVRRARQSIAQPAQGVIDEDDGVDRG